MDIVVPSDPLTKKKQMGLFTASLYHREQRQTLQDVECGNCRQKGHLRKNCKNEAVCYECLRPGHMCEEAMIDASENENKEILNSQSEGEEREDGGKKSGEESGNESGEDIS